jgi:hypothetical protein
MARPTHVMMDIFRAGGPDERTGNWYKGYTDRRILALAARATKTGQEALNMFIQSKRLRNERFELR